MRIVLCSFLNFKFNFAKRYFFIWRFDSEEFADVGGADDDEITSRLVNVVVSTLNDSWTVCPQNRMHEVSRIAEFLCGE